MKSLATLQNIADPKRRALAASETVRDLDTQLEETRARRDVAACIAHLDHGVAPVALYRDVLNLSRALFNRMTQRAPSAAERAKLIAERPELFGDADTAIKTARKAARDVPKIEEKLAAVHELRNDTGRGLMEGDFEGIRPMSNADFARLCNITTARAAQIRYGDTGKNPAAPAAAAAV